MSEVSWQQAMGGSAGGVHGLSPRQGMQQEQDPRTPPFLPSVGVQASGLYGGPSSIPGGLASVTMMAGMSPGFQLGQSLPPPAKPQEPSQSKYNVVIF